MKKILFIFAAIFTMMIAVAQPLMVKPINSYAIDDTTLNSIRGNRSASVSNYPYYLAYDLHWDHYYTNDPENSAPKNASVVVFFNEAGLQSISGDFYSWDLTCNYNNIKCCVAIDGGYYWNTNINTMSFSNSKFSWTSGGNDYNYFDRAWHLNQNYVITDYQTNIDSLQQPPQLNLSVSFTPTMSGAVSRTGTSNGHEIEYKYLDMDVVNNGANAQWAMFIVPTGQSITFPSDLLNTPQGFIGSPTFAYITDEWIDWTNGSTNMTGWLDTGSSGIGIDMQMLYSPCAWRTMIQGSNRTYRINWDMMKLTKDVSYDVVVYGMINAEPVNASASGSGLGCWTVLSRLDDVQEVYRSTFTMSDPVDFNPNSIDEGNAAHPWNPDTDNTSLFNHGNVYKDANGNLVIKGSAWESGGNGNIYGTNSNINVNSSFGGFFSFFRGILNCFPPAWLTIITLGLSAIVIAAIIKKVSS